VGTPVINCCIESLASSVLSNATKSIPWHDFHPGFSNSPEFCRYTCYCVFPSSNEIGPG
jgi:hypothetical protein